MCSGFTKSVKGAVKSGGGLRVYQECYSNKKLPETGDFCFQVFTKEDFSNRMMKMVKKNQRKRMAFIDVYNTINTTEKLLNFSIDWEKLYNHLKNKWNCEKVFFYSGIDVGDIDTEQEYKKLEALGYTIRIKTTIPYKNKDKQVNIKCKKCGFENIETIRGGYKKKSNCDVELTVDALENAEKDAELLIFTGDGDFEYLIRVLTEKKDAYVCIVSNGSKNAVTDKRFSHKLRKLFTHDKVKFVDIDSWRNIIKKDMPAVK